MECTDRHGRCGQRAQPLSAQRHLRFVGVSGLLPYRRGCTQQGSPGNSARAALSSLRLRNRQHLSRMNQVGVADATGVGDLLVPVAVAVEPLGDGPQRVAGHHGVGPRSRRRRWRRRRWRAVGAREPTAPRPPRVPPRASRPRRPQAAVAPRRCACSTTRRARRNRRAPDCGRPAGPAGHPWRPLYRCARSACPVCTARSCRPSAPRGARRSGRWSRSPTPLLRGGKHQVAVVLQGQRVCPVL